MSLLEEQIRGLRKGAQALSITDDDTRKKALESMAEAIIARKDEITAANNDDIANAEKAGIPSSILHRLKFSDDKIASAVKGLRELAALPDPVGRIREMRELDEGFVLKKVSFPIGVIAMIFEARPDALVQIAGLAMKSGNAVVLKEIPPNATAVGVPARVVRIAGEKVDYASSVDQIHVTDPVQKELQAISSRLEWLEKLMDEQARSQNQ